MSGGLSDGRLLGAHRAVSAQLYADRNGGWTTADLLGRALWPESEWNRKFAERLLRRLVADGFFIVRRHRSGNVHVIARKGVDWAADGGSFVRTGLGFGRTSSNGAWNPPPGFAHDCRAAKFFIAARALKAITEAEVRRWNPGLKKIPDGLLLVARTTGLVWFWLEVEGARKSGSAADELADAAINISQGRGPRLRTGDGEVIRPTSILFLLPTDSRDERGFLVGHEKRIIAAIERRHRIGATCLHFSDELDGGSYSPYRRVVIDGTD